MKTDCIDIKKSLIRLIPKIRFRFLVYGIFLKQKSELDFAKKKQSPKRETIQFSHCYSKDLNLIFIIKYK